MINSLIRLAESGLVPDIVLRKGMRAIIAWLFKDFQHESPEQTQEAIRNFVVKMRKSPIAINTDEANDQHYELPAVFFQWVLGPHLKYSGSYFPQDVTSLEVAEAVMLEMSCKRAQITDGISVLDLGCGWGSLSLYIAKHYPNSKVTAVSNSTQQASYILEQAQLRGLANVDVITADMNDFATEKRFDRVVSVEMFEHMRNWSLLLKRISGWLRPQGKLFVHVFTHHSHAYSFGDADNDLWMARYFFTGGIMPSNHLMYHFNEDLKVCDHWVIDGTHYQKTAEAWLANLDTRAGEVRALFASVYGQEEMNIWFHRWRLFFLAVSETWGYRQGREWMISHYLLQKS